MIPIDHEAERALIGACLQSEAAIVATNDIVDFADFNDSRHSTIWRALIDAYTTGPADIVTITGLVRGHGIEPEYLLELHDARYSVTRARSYALRVVDAHVRRRLLLASNDIAELATGKQAAYDAADAAAKARDLIAHLDLPTGIGAPDPDVDSFVNSIDMSHDWLIEGFLERRDRMLITAGEGAGKSVLLAQLAVQAAVGIHPWTRDDVPPRNVLLIDLENGERLVSRRLADLRRIAGIHLDPQRLRVHIRPQGLDLTTRTDLRWLLDRCQANAAELLVIGPAYRMSAGVAERGDVGGEDHTRMITKALDEVRQRCNVTLLMETHAPHGQGGSRDMRPFGSSVWLRWPEFGLGLKMEPDNHQRFRFEHWRGPRDQRDWPTHLERGGKWPWTPIMPTGTFRSTAA